ncbi:MAG: AAA family ATPase, partial [Actinomycetes bacterium]
VEIATAVGEALSAQAAPGPTTMPGTVPGTRSVRPPTMPSAAGSAAGSGRLDYGDPAAALADLGDGAGIPDEPPVAAGSGRLVAVWGPTGAPGRTTVAVGLAAELAAAGTPTLLADADVYGGVVAQVLGFLDEAPGLAAAARLANLGQLDLAALARVSPSAAPRLRVLTGISRAERWTELRPAALEAVWSMARSLVAVTVVDCGFCLEQDEELSFDTAAPRRNGATLATLAAADVVVAVGGADPVGMQRLVRALADLRDALPGVAPRVVLTKVRRTAVGGDPEAQLAAALDRYAGVRDVSFLPDDRDALDAALLQGRLLVDAAPDSPLRLALAELASTLTGRPAPRRRRRLLRRGG